MTETPGNRLRRAMDEERPLQVAGAINAYFAMLAERAGFRAVYLSGAGVANASFGLPDLGMTSLADVLVDARRITAATDVPLIVDCDTGWGSPLTIARTVREMQRAGVAAIHLEDQVDAKRCGHRPGKQLVAMGEMLTRLRAADEARSSDELVLIARTDAAAVTGFDDAVARANAYVEAGADVIFAEALTTAEEFRRFAAAVPAPILANMTEFGRSPLLTVEQLRSLGIGLVLYPLTAFRAASAAAERTYTALRDQGTQRELLDDLQTRERLYEVLDYHAHERRLDDSASTNERNET